MKLKIMIFGASGNTGHYLTRRFLDVGHEVFGLSRRHVDIKSDRHKHLKIDLRDSNALADVSYKPDIIVNLAGVQPSILSEEAISSLDSEVDEYVFGNIKTHANVLKFARQNQPKTLFFASTHREMQNYWNNDDPVSDGNPPSFDTFDDHGLFTATKYASSLIGEIYGNLTGLRIFNLRLPMMFMIPKNPYYLVRGKPKLMPFLEVIRKSTKGIPVPIWGNPDLRRDYSHVENLFRMIDVLDRSDLVKGTYTVGTGEGVSTEVFVRALAGRFWGGEDEPQFTYDSNVQTFKNSVYDIAPQRELGFEPVLLKDMVKRLHIEYNSFREWKF